MTSAPRVCRSTPRAPTSQTSWTRTPSTQISSHANPAPDLAPPPVPVQACADTGFDAVGFDFAVAEECGVHSECGDYTQVFGDRVVDVEYDDTGFARACAAVGDRIAVARRDVEVTTPGSSCA